MEIIIPEIKNINFKGMLNLANNLLSDFLLNSLIIDKIAIMKANKLFIKSMSSIVMKYL